MLFPFHSMILLALESSSVIGLRLLKLASGGRDAADEAHLMVNEDQCCLRSWSDSHQRRRRRGCD
jgi:hypothetical protein